MRRWTTATVMAALSLLGCAEETRPAQHGDDAHAVGTLPLSLLPAPAGLCGGDGADKECGPGGCAEAPEAAAGRGPSAQGAAMSTPSGPLPTQPAAAPMPAQSDPGGFAPPQDNTAPMPEPQAPEPTCSDVGVDAGAGMCVDAGIGAAQAALILDDVPGCEMISADKPATLYLSADDSNSMAGPVIARRMIELGQRVPAHVVRPWEFLNYYDFSFEPAAPGEVRIVPQLSSCATDRLSLQVALSAEARLAEKRAPLTLTFVLDTSGSMGSALTTGETPIGLSKAAVTAIASQLRDGDVVSMVTWDTEQEDILSGHAVTGADDPVLLEAARGLTANGGTNLNAGLMRGYALAEKHYGPDRINRVILISDGIANVGVTDENLIGRFADDEEGKTGIYLAGIGVGDGVNDTLMNAVTDTGRGAYIYLDDAAEADHMLRDRFLQVVDLAVRNVRLEVTLPYYMVLEQFFGEVASTTAANVRPQHLAPNDAMLYFQVLRACDPSLLRGDDRIRIRATWETPFTRVARSAEIDATLNELAGDDADLTKAAAIAGYAEALIAVSGSSDAGQQRAVLEQALADVQDAKGGGIDPDLIEVERLIARYLMLFKTEPEATYQDF